MHCMPSPSVALDSLECGGDMGLRDGQEVEIPVGKQHASAENQLEERDSVENAQQPITGESGPQHTIFLCLRGNGQEEYALQTLCQRSGRIKISIFQDENDDCQVVFTEENCPPFDDDATIYQKLNVACYKHYGRWKRWVPFYGIVDAHEVTVSAWSTSDPPLAYKSMAVPLPGYDR